MSTLVDAVVQAQEVMTGQTASMAIAMKRSGVERLEIDVEYSWAGTDADLLYICDILVGLVERKRLAVMAREDRQRFSATDRGGRVRGYNHG